MLVSSLGLAGFRGLDDKIYDLEKVNNLIGENGSGKTSIFEAIQLCLFGTQSNLHKENRRAHSYNKFLEAKVNRDSLRICSGTSINLGRSAISGYKYSWTSISGASYSSSSANPTVSPKVDTKYKLVVSSSDGLCKPDSATILVRVNPRMSQEFLADTFFCEGYPVTIDGLKGMFFYEWEIKSMGKKSNNNS